MMLGMASDQHRSDREVTADLMDRLRHHYVQQVIGGSSLGGRLLEEVGWNGTENSRRCDALFIGFTSTTGRLLVGHEVKASRADWRNELRQLDKAGEWADQCHQWWLVTVPGVVNDGELPNGWGLMVPGRGRLLKVLTPARNFPNRVPSWDAARSIVARVGTAERA